MIAKLVKAVIKSKNTGKFLGADGLWTPDAANAFGFADTEAVIAAVQKYKLADVEMIILMGDTPGKYDAVVTLTDFGGLRTRPGGAESLEG